jgi:TetR/AcrR family transcriptional regulator
MDESEKKSIRWTAVFDRIPEDKKNRVLASAKSAFAAKGFTGTNVNAIAEDAGISVGSLYKYFRTKEDLFLALIEDAHSLLETTLDLIFAREKTFFGRVESILRAAVDTTKADPELIRIYIACTTEELSPLAEKLSGRIESVSAHKYRKMVEEAAARGEIRPPADSGACAFFLDDIFLMVQFSFGSRYYRERLRLFVGEASAGNAESLIAALMDTLRKTFAP